MDISHDWQTVLTRHGNDIEKAHDKIRVVESSIETIKSKINTIDNRVSNDASVDTVKQLLTRQLELLQHHASDAVEGFDTQTALINDFAKKQAAAFDALSRRVTALFGLIIALGVLSVAAARYL